MGDGGSDCEGHQGPGYRADNIGDATRLMDVVRGAIGVNQATAGSAELLGMLQELSRFQQESLRSVADLCESRLTEQASRKVNLSGHIYSGFELPDQKQLRAIVIQQNAAARDIQSTIKGFQQ
ncbi:hypothetical protein BGZ63DRAFT_429675 [Mariannaea sp. PMI_226]|nr:hypothetical protein BGZ63DRAFT_429675 [Mariannaea sp. PMI_226]